ncbi:hypothetical protein HW555_002054 [Spodoptera exigua]|uniref:Uncharacterized protein n=1 Tax=Spodoptera exigua TaxID=7107 RepID=A0A835GNY7_SPOEX|nr:hypothetical protein HW555_002054 [Spodoptera exigua]
MDLGRHKRNATFPGGQTASLLQSSTTRKYSADASTLRDVADGCQASRPRYCSGGTTTWPGPRVQPPQPEIPSLAAPTPIDTKVTEETGPRSFSPIPQHNLTMIHTSLQNEGFASIKFSTVTINIVEA